jgi:hypothetical protein
MVPSARENIKLKKKKYSFNFIVLQLGFVSLLILDLPWLISLQNKALLADIQSHAASQRQWLDRWEKQIIMLRGGGGGRKKKKKIKNLKKILCFCKKNT